ncbi:MAG TPA: FkbM family methyltransferase [Gemmataceae bacterium]|nr:FkbM family methyltransferase [Gemmataceae bacterium]
MTMLTDARRRIAGKMQAGRALLEFARHLKNWPAVWRAYRRGQPIPSPLVLRNGLVVEFGPDDDPVQLFREIFVRACYTPRWFYRPTPGDQVVDLGANIGVFALAVAGIARGLRCHCFEPAAGTRGRLLRNAEVNGLTEFIRVYPNAVAAAAGTLTLRAGASTIHRSLFANDMATDTPGETVEAVTLGRALEMTGADRIDLLKVDIEGAELDVFPACLPDVLAPVRRVVVEYHDHFRPGARAATEAALRAAGFSAPRVDPAGPEGGVLYATRS